jgi:uncharacterized protein (DUF983 family)
MRIAITCERCGHRMEMRRRVFAPEVVYIVCHECEGVLESQARAVDIVETTPAWARLLSDVGMRR